METKRIKKGGRPPKQEARRNLHVKVYCTGEERENIQKHTVASGAVSMSDYLLHCGLNKHRELPRYRALPPAVNSHLLILKQLAGAFTLAALKTEKEIRRSQELKEQSQQIKELVKAIERYLRDDRQS